MRNLFTLLFLYQKIGLMIFGAILTVMFLATGHALNTSDEGQLYFSDYIGVFIVSSAVLFAINREKPRKRQKGLFIIAAVCLVAVLLSFSQTLFESIRISGTSGIVTFLGAGIVNTLFILSVFIFKPTIVFIEKQQDEFN